MDGFRSGITNGISINHCPDLSVRYHDFSGFHVEHIFALKILFLL